MKKQILLLAFFILAIFASKISYAQDINYILAPTKVPATALPCANDDELHPLPGKSYTYTVDINPALVAAGTGYVQWFVYNATDNGAAIITAGSIATAASKAEESDGSGIYLLSAPAGVYNDPTNTIASIDLTWKPFDGNQKQILLVAYVKGDASCSDNIEVYRIIPPFSFTLDIAGLMPDGSLPGAALNANECVTPVQSASYNGTELAMDYGDNYIYYTVNAANFVNSWQPDITIVENLTQSSVALTDITWAYPTEAVKNDGATPPAANGTWNSITTPVLAQDATGVVGKDGEQIVVRVHIDHNKNENDANTARTFTLGVDGIMFDVNAASAAAEYTNAALKDLDPSAAGAACTNVDIDQAIYELVGRPEITTNLPALPLDFEPKN